MSATHDHAHDHGGGGHGGDHHEHIHPPSHYVKIWGLLVALLVASVIGPFIGDAIRSVNPTVAVLVTLTTAFGIAFVKAGMVVKYFMHLDAERPIVWYILITCVVFMVLLFAAVSPDILNHEGQRWENVAAKAEIARALKEHGEHGGHGAHGEAAPHGEAPAPAEGH